MTRAVRVSLAVLLWVGASSGMAQNSQVSNVPDAVTRKTGLHVEPMPRAARLVRIWT